jgi:hypothetical protein
MASLMMMMMMIKRGAAALGVQFRYTLSFYAE